MQDDFNHQEKSAGVQWFKGDEGSVYIFRKLYLDLDSCLLSLPRLAQIIKDFITDLQCY
jgi:hypothetical protein